MWCCMVVAITLTCDVWYNGVLASRLYCAGGGSVPGTVALPVLDTRYQYGRFSMKVNTPGIPGTGVQLSPSQKNDQVS